jgi:phosphatidylglycerophosphate synthase
VTDTDTQRDGGGVPTVRTGPVIGLLAQVAVLVVLAATVGLGLAGWLAGLAFGLVTLVLLRGARLGPADRVTLGRATLVGGVTALVAESLTRPEPVAVLVPLAAAALALDAVDGWVARRTDTVSRLGARFDMEVDAYLILVLSGYVADRLGGWVLAIGLMRYAFAAAGWVVPWLRAELPPRYWRKVVAATQGVVLVLGASGLLPRPVATAVVAVGLGMLVESFGRDVGWLWRHRAVGPADRAGDRAVGRPVHGSVRGGAVRPGRHPDPADRERYGVAARRGDITRHVPGPRSGRPGVAAGARPQ